MFLVNENRQFHMKKIIILSLTSIFLISYIASCKKETTTEPDSKPWDGVEGQVKDFTTFDNERLAFGGGNNQTSEKTFNLHEVPNNVKNIKMYIKLECPTGGCNAWDVYANIKVKDISSGEWYEIGRYITPYGVDNSAFPDGYEIDVTDFKFQLSGATELRARIETWGADGWNLTVNFKYTLGQPDYEYYAVNDLMKYDEWSTSGVPYGIAHTKDLTRTITVPANSQETSLRTIISGWGHTKPTDTDGRPCAEWCFRTHKVKIDGNDSFNHQMGSLSCSTNPTNNQAGNWQPDRAGWCPGMAVPLRIDMFTSPKAGNSVSFEYFYQPWTSNGTSTSGTVGAYYATSCFVIVKSDTPIDKPVVVD
ncbi:MAG: hypothetical protein ACI8RY_001675 [Urechidicola sp.]